MHPHYIARTGILHVYVRACVCVCVCVRVCMAVRSYPMYSKHSDKSVGAYACVVCVCMCVRAHTCCFKVLYVRR